MGLGGAAADLPDDGGDVDSGPDFGGGKVFGLSMVSCSICLEVVTDNGDRSWAKLQCGHRFHLDCIGSAFNVKGAMQCPNCRKIEKGQWLYANSCRPFPDFNMDDWIHDEDLYDSYSEMSFGVQWCPFSGLTRLPSFIHEGEFPSTAYHNLLGQHALLAEQPPVSSATHPCPYVAYLGPIHPSSSNSSGSVPDGPNLNHHWNGQSVPNDVPTSYAFPTMDPQYHNWEHHSSPFTTTGSSRIGGTDQPSVTQRLSRASSDVPRPGTFANPFLVGHHSSGARAGGSVGASGIPPYPGSNARARGRVQALQAYYQQQQPSHLRAPVVSSTRRSSGHRGGAAHVGSTGGSSSDQAGGNFYFFQESENPVPTRYPGWERDQYASFPLSRGDGDSGWGLFHQAATAPEPSPRASGFRLRHGSDRPSQNR